MTTTNQEGYIYNDYNNYFDEIVPDEALRQPKNFPLFKSLEEVISDIAAISNEQQTQQLRKDILIGEMAVLFEQIYINCNREDLIQTIAASMVFILTKKDKITTSQHIYNVLDKKAKGKYSGEYGHTKRTDIFSLRNVKFQTLMTALDTVLEYSDIVPSLDKAKQQEILQLYNQIDDFKNRSLLELESSLYQDHNITDYDNSGSYSADGLPLEREVHWTNDTGTYGPIGSYELGTADPTSPVVETSEGQSHDKYQPYPSKYYSRLEHYIQVLTKLKENVGKYPPSSELDEKLDQALALEIEILMPCVDLKFKRSLPQLDETIQYADSQSLNGASSVMHETALIESEDGTIVDFSKAPLRRYKEFIHKLTPEQIDTRHGYISAIRKKLGHWLPHLYYNILYYEGSKKYNHHISIGKLARSNLLKKKLEGKN